MSDAASPKLFRVREVGTPKLIPSKNKTVGVTSASYKKSKISQEHATSGSDRGLLGKMSQKAKLRSEKLGFLDFIGLRRGKVIFRQSQHAEEDAAASGASFELVLMVAQLKNDAAARNGFG